MGGNTKKQILKQLLLPALMFVAVFGLYTTVVFAQQTGAPGVDEDATNVPGLLRIYDPDGIQVKSGGLRVGASGTLDITSKFEVIGNLRVADQLLVAAQGVCSSGSGTEAPTCQFEQIGQKYPTFLVQTADENYDITEDGNSDVVKGFTGIGTNKGLGQLAVYAPSTDQFLGGALYASSTAGHGVWGVAQGIQKAGVVGLVINANSIGVFGKSLDSLNRGVSGYSDGTGTAPAGYFYGNVVVTGGYLQGNASGLYRVSSINDASLPTSEGGRGIGVWANQTPITINPSGTTVFPLDFTDGARVRSFTVYIANSATSYAYSQLSDAIPVKAEISETEITFINSSPEEYLAKVVVQVETGLTITLSHTEPAGTYGIDNTQPVVFEPNGYFEMTANVGSGLSQSFTWEFDTPTPVGQLCPGESPSGCTTQAAGLTGETVYYRFPSSYSGGKTPLVPLKVTWNGSGAGSEVSRSFILRTVDILAPTTPKIPYNAGSGGEPAYPIQVSYITPSGTGNTNELFFDVGTNRNQEDIDANGNYTAPNVKLDDATGLGSAGRTAEIIVSLVSNPEAAKTITAYLVPDIVIESTYPLPVDAGNPLGGLPATTMATNKPLSVTASVDDSFLTPPPEIISCTGCTSGADPVWSTKSLTLGKKTLTFTWQSSTGYPSPVTVTKDYSVYVGDLQLAETISGAKSTNILIPVNVDVNTVSFPNIISELSATVYHLNTTLPVAADFGPIVPPYTSNPQIKGGSGHITSIATTPNQPTSQITFNSDSCNAGTPFSVVVRSPFDYRQTKAINVTVTGCSTTTCNNCSGCPGTPKFCDPCCGSGGSVGGSS